MKQPYDIEKLNVMTWLRFPLILGVVLSHSNLYGLVELWEGTAPDWPAWLIYIFKELFKIILPLRVPTLFIISGYLFFRSQKPRDKGFFIYKYKRRIHSLLIPYLAWNTIAIAILFARYNIAGSESHTVTEYLSGYWDLSLRDGEDPADGPLWFMRDLMVVSLLAPLLNTILRKRKTGILFLIFVTLLDSARIYIPLTGFSNTAILFFSIGAYLALHDIDFTHIPKAIGITALILYIPSQIVLNNMSDSSAYASATYDLTGIIKTIATFYIVSLLFRKKVLSPTPRLTKLCFTLYALHGIVVGPIIKTLYYHIPHSDNPAALLAIYITTVLTIIALTAILITKSREYFPRISGILSGNRG